jgi:hypothetical protein
MSISVQHNGTTYLSSKEAGRLSGYTSDYVAKLAREGKILATRVGIQWFVEPASLNVFLEEAERARIARKEALRVERLREREETFRTPQTLEQPSEQHLKVRYEHTAENVVELNIAELDEVSIPSLVPAQRAHLEALAVVAVGTACAFVFAVAPAVSGLKIPAPSNAAFPLGALMETLTFSRWFVFPWSNEIAVVPPGSQVRNASGLGGELQLNAQSHQGIVVLPGNASDATLQTVRDSFSDDVLTSVSDDGTSGTIVPVFSDGAGEQYRFVIVPVGQSP